MSSELTIDGVTRVMLALVLSVSLAGCDGGIFGTGDGEELIPTDIISIEGAPGEGGDGGNGSDADPANPELVLPGNSVFDFEPTEDVLVSSSGELSLSNSFVVSAGSAPAVNLINLSGAQIELHASADTDALPLISTAGNQVTNSANIPAGASTLFIDSVSNNERMNLVQLDVSNLMDGTRTLLILRSLQPSAEVIALPIIVAGASEDDRIAVRIVSAAVIGDPAMASVFSLTPAGSGSADNPRTFNPIDAEFPVSQYEFIEPGLYALSDDVGRYTDIPLDLSAPLLGGIVTLVLDPSLPGQSMLLMDSVLP